MNPDGERVSAVRHLYIFGNLDVVDEFYVVGALSVSDALSKVS